MLRSDEATTQPLNTELSLILGNSIGGLALAIVALVVFLRMRAAFWVTLGIMALGIVVGEESLTQVDAGARCPAVRVTLAPAAEAAPKVGRCENEGRQGKWT